MPSRKKRRHHRNHNPTSNVQPLKTSAVEAILYGAPLPDIHTQQRLEEARRQAEASRAAQIKYDKEKAQMTNMQAAMTEAFKQQQQAALTRILDEWDDQPTTSTATKPQPKLQTKENVIMGKEKAFFNVTTNVSRATFEYVRDNPNKHHREIILNLGAKGFKESSVSALLSQYRRCGTMVRSDEWEYTTTTDTYSAPSSAKLKKAKAAPKAKPKYTIPLPPPTLPERTPHPAAGLAALKPQPAVITNEIEHILNTLPIKQARALYDELHKIFGARA